MVNVLFTIFVFISIWSGFLCFGNLFRKQGVPPLNILIMAVGFTGVITHIIGIW